MTKFNASAEIVEVNRYDFVVEAETKEEAETKFQEFLKVILLTHSNPNP